LKPRNEKCNRKENYQIGNKIHHPCTIILLNN
jgi:hypothetical protein